MAANLTATANTAVLYGIEGKYRDVSELVIRNCGSASRQSLILYGDDHQRSRVFGDHIVGTLKHLVIVRASTAMMCEQGKDVAIDECLGVVGPFHTFESNNARNNATTTTAQPTTPRILIAILAKQKALILPFYLKCIEALDYPKDRIVLYVRTNNNRDNTAEILRDWIARVGSLYSNVLFDDSDVETPVQQYGVHEWNPVRFKVLADIRQRSLLATLVAQCDFYFTADVDNFIRPQTLRTLVSANLPIIAPLLRHVDSTSMYSNFHSAVDSNGYFASHPMYHEILYRRLLGPLMQPVVHCTYLIRADVIPKLYYEDSSGRYEYVIFSDSARRNGVPQYFDNRQVYGYLTMEDNSDRARSLMESEIDAVLSTK